MRLERIPVPNWREAAVYGDLLEADRACFAWEWLRRDPEYRTAAIRPSEGRCGAMAARCNPPRWGLHAFENPGLDFSLARPMWTATAYSAVLAADALPAPSASAIFDMRALGSVVSRLRGTDGCEHILFGDGPRLIRLDICSGSIARGRKMLRFRIDGPAGLDRRLLTLRRLMALARTGRFSRELHRREARARQWLLTLRAADAVAGGASQREIAEVLLGFESPPVGWRQEDPNVRARAQRLVQQARRLAHGGFAVFLT